MLPQCCSNGFARNFAALLRDVQSFCRNTTSAAVLRGYAVPKRDLPKPGKLAVCKTLGINRQPQSKRVQAAAALCQLLAIIEHRYGIAALTPSPRR